MTTDAPTVKSFWSYLDFNSYLAKFGNGITGKPGGKKCPTEKLVAKFDEAIVRTLIEHGVPFSVMCIGAEEMEGCASGDDAPADINEAIKTGWTMIHPAAAENEMSHFWGRCPECTKLQREAERMESDG